MKKYFLLAAPLAFLACEGGESEADLTTDEVETTVSVDYEDPKNKLSYAMGADAAYGMFQNQLAEYIDADAFSAGFKAAINGDSLVVSSTEGRLALQQMEEEKMKSRAQEFLPNLEAGQKFLEENATRPEVKTTMSGLQYEILEEGTGATPGYTDIFEAHYTGTKLNGEKFDSSFDHPERRDQEGNIIPAGSPLKREVARVIPGWTEALQLMKVGAKWKIYIPQELAYGEGGTPGGPIDPYEVLIFELELVGMEKGQ